MLGGLSRSLAHAGRLVAVARALTARGHRCVLAGAPGWFADERLVRPGELAVETVHEPALAGVLAPSEGSGDDLAAVIRADRDLLARLTPDVVVFDNRRTLGLVARAGGVPTVSLTNATVLGPHLGVVPTVEQVLGIVAPASGVDRSVLAASPAWRDRDPQEPVPTGAVPLPDALLSMLAGHGLPAPDWTHELSLGDTTLVCDDPRLVPLRDTPAGVKSVGPILPTLTVAEPPWWGRLPQDTGRVLVSFGSTGSAQARSAVVGALVGSGLTVIAAGESARPGLLSAPWLPPETARLVDLVVCHGGSGTIYRALAAGRPVLAVPAHAEQALNAVAVVQAGLGVALTAQAVAQHPGALRDLVGRLVQAGPLHDATRAYAAGLSLETGAGHAADAIAALV